MNRSICILLSRRLATNKFAVNSAPARCLSLSTLLKHPRGTSDLTETTSKNNMAAKNTRENEEKDPKDRSRIIPLELSIKYMESPAFREVINNQFIILNFYIQIIELIVSSIGLWGQENLGIVQVKQCQTFQEIQTN